MTDGPRPPLDALQLGMDAVVDLHEHWMQEVEVGHRLMELGVVAGFLINDHSHNEPLADDVLTLSSEARRPRVLATDPLLQEHDGIGYEFYIRRCQIQGGYIDELCCEPTVRHDNSGRGVVLAAWPSNLSAVEQLPPIPIAARLDYVIMLEGIVRALATKLTGGTAVGSAS